ncbi:unnamed protein product [Staurois parvus]|uniref:ELMO domain-containing protein n=1 Tax=Staurois parvus TaxID=386267 RepID=A0ABN9H7A3_9NEOB|nr:unnamed protein product [Staurois parvus]
MCRILCSVISRCAVQFIILDYYCFRFQINLRICLLQISGYKKLFLEVEDVRKQPYNSDNPEHEQQLMELWDLLMPHEKLKSRITKQWGDIGFQGDDPKTDFRGMGILGLANLLPRNIQIFTCLEFILFSRNHSSKDTYFKSYSASSLCICFRYSYAIVGINLTEMAYSLLKSGALKSHFYNMVPGFPEIKVLPSVFL